MDINNKMITGQPGSISDSCRKEENQKEHYEDKFIIKLFYKLSKNNGIISTK